MYFMQMPFETYQSPISQHSIDLQFKLTTDGQAGQALASRGGLHFYDSIPITMKI